MSYAARIARLEKRVKAIGAGPCPVCRRKRNPDIARLAALQLEQWRWIWADVFADQVDRAASALQDLLCPRCQRCSLGYADCADAYFLANQDSDESKGEEPNETYE